MKINGIEINADKLKSGQELIDFLNENGSCDRALDEIRESRIDMYGNVLMWKYPISDGIHEGGAIVVVKEGFLWLPYNSVDYSNYEHYELDGASMFDEASLRLFIDDWKSYSDDLLGAMNDMLILAQNAADSQSETGNT